MNGEKIETNNSLSLKDLFKILWFGKVMILGFSFSFGIIGYLISESMTKEYTCESINYITIKGNGFDVARYNGNNSINMVLNELNSKEFIKNFIYKNKIGNDIVYTSGWDRNKDDLIFYEDKKDNINLDVAADVFLNKFFKAKRLSQDEIKLSIRFYSPKMANYWLGNIIDDFNLWMVNKAKENAKLNVEYINEHIDSRTTTYNSLMEEQQRTLMLAEFSKDYVLGFVEPIKLKSDSPNVRVLISSYILMGAIFGLIITFVRLWINNVSK